MTNQFTLSWFCLVPWMSCLQKHTKFVRRKKHFTLNWCSLVAWVSCLQINTLKSRYAGHLPGVTYCSSGLVAGRFFVLISEFPNRNRTLFTNIYLWYMNLLSETRKYWSIKCPIFHPLFMGHFCKTNGSSQSCLSRWDTFNDNLSRTQIDRLTRHKWEFWGGKGTRLHRKQNKQTECFLSQSWPLFSSLHLAVSCWKEDEQTVLQLEGQTRRNAKELNVTTAVYLSGQIKKKRPLRGKRWRRNF